MEKISAVIMCFNEEENLPRLIESLKGADEVIIVDHMSTDKTSELAKSLGAKVFQIANKIDTVFQSDREEFIKKYGFFPTFKAGDKIGDGSADRAYGISKAKNDWVFCPDADEIVTWDLPEIKKLLTDHDQINCNFIHSRKPNGSPECVLEICKLFRKSNSRWYGRIHDVVVGTNPRTIKTDKMKMEHFKKPKEYRNGQLGKMEYALFKDQSPRMLFYTAREYFYNAMYEKALQLYNEYMPKAWWRSEIAEAWLLMAKCSWQIQKGDDSRKYCLNAIAVNPDFKEALLDMSEYTGDDQKEYWKRYADIATSNNVLFKRV